jgi:hypothetical protein
MWHPKHPASDVVAIFGLLMTRLASLVENLKLDI